MSVQSDHEKDPFHVNYAPNKSTSTPGEKRTAFRQDSHGVLVSGKGKFSREERGIRKSGSRIRIEGGRALRFAHSLHLPVPAVHELKYNSSEQTTEILMDFKRSIAEQPRHILNTTRRAPPTQTEIGAFDGPARDCRRFSDNFGGPFQTEAEFNPFVLDFLRGTPSLIRTALAAALGTGSRTVLTHGDLCPRNILVKGTQVMAVLDLEFAGWYPEYWEYGKFFDRTTDCKDWKAYAVAMYNYSIEFLVFVIA